MLAQVSKWGNSLALRIPTAFAREIAIEDGRAVEIAIIDGKLVISPVIATPAYNLEDLISQMKPEDYLNYESFDDAPRGNEGW